jgi:hypothetical protein
MDFTYFRLLQGPGPNFLGIFAILGLLVTMLYAIESLLKFANQIEALYPWYLFIEA